MPAEEYLLRVGQLGRYAAQINLAYLYVVKMDNGKVVFFVGWRAGRKKSRPASSKSSLKNTRRQRRPERRTDQRLDAL